MGAAGHGLDRARSLFERKRWAECCRLLEAADRGHPLEPDDLERLATAAYLLHRDDDSESALTRAHQAFLERGDVEGAARCASRIAFGLLQRGAAGPASGWFARAERLLDDAQADSVVRGYLLIPVAIRNIVQGNPSAGHTTFDRIAGIARRFGDRELASVACHGRGRALIRLGHVAAGVAMLDEAMAAVTAGDVSPVMAGDVYCSVLEGCQETFDVRRAYEWTASLARWCAGQRGLVRYQGECLLYRAEVMQLRGRWTDAARDAHEACRLLMARPIAGAAFYRLGEIHRLRTEYADAESAYGEASERGRKPQPGLSLLRLAKGEIDAAAAAIRNALLDAQTQAARARVLAAAVEILLPAGDVGTAQTASVELSQVASAIGAPLLQAMSDHAAGAVCLTTGDMPGASTHLERAREAWIALSMPYDEARTRLLLAKVCERRGDGDGVAAEAAAAERLLAQLEGERSAHLPPGGPNGTLSRREVEVLRLLATGRTNREIGEVLFISVKTVARHVSNIFDKLGVSSRTAAASVAHRHNLI
jgi:DNA-binding CsgD family transcriptional regulator/tetratricopeptide (TPR) repeat protein